MTWFYSKYFAFQEGLFSINWLQILCDRLPFRFSRGLQWLLFPVWIEQSRSGFNYGEGSENSLDLRQCELCNLTAVTDIGMLAGLFPSIYRFGHAKSVTVGYFKAEYPSNNVQPSKFIPCVFTQFASLPWRLCLPSSVTLDHGIWHRYTNSFSQATIYPPIHQYSLHNSYSSVGKFRYSLPQSISLYVGDHDIAIRIGRLVWNALALVHLTQYSSFKFVCIGKYNGRV